MTDQPGGNPPEQEPPPPSYGQQPPPPPPPPQQPPPSPYGQPGGYPPGPPSAGGYPPPPSYGQMPAGPMGGSPPPNYLVWAILTTLFCCLPLGIASIVFAAQVNSKWSAGDADGARESSRKARQFAMWAAIAGVVVGVLYIVFGVILASSSNS